MYIYSREIHHWIGLRDILNRKPCLFHTFPMTYVPRIFFFQRHQLSNGMYRMGIDVRFGILYRFERLIRIISSSIRIPNGIDYNDPGGGGSEEQRQRRGVETQTRGGSAEKNTCGPPRTYRKIGVTWVIFPIFGMGMAGFFEAFCRC